MFTVVSGSPQCVTLSLPQVVLPVNLSLCGDVTVVVYHARRVMGRVTGVRIAQLQFHTGFVDEEDTSIRFAK